MPMERHRYPKDWKQIAAQVKEEAGWKCEECGKQCPLPPARGQGAPRPDPQAQAGGVPATHGGTCQCGRSGFLNLSFFPGRAATLLYRSRLP